MTQKRMRADGQRNRQTILEAAARVFARDGFVIAMDRIAAEAGVGRATLYRNFANREALALAVFAENVDRFEQTARDIAPGPDEFRTLFDALAEDIAAHAALGQALAYRTGHDELAELRDRTLDAFLPALMRAIESGTIRPDVTRADLGLLLDTIGLGLPPGELEQRCASLRRLLALLFDGLKA